MKMLRQPFRSPLISNPKSAPAAPQSENTLWPVMGMFLSPCASAASPVAMLAVAMTPARRTLALRQVVSCVLLSIGVTLLMRWWCYLMDAFRAQNPTSGVDPEQNDPRPQIELLGLRDRKPIDDAALAHDDDAGTATFVVHEEVVCLAQLTQELLPLGIRLAERNSRHGA